MGVVLTGLQEHTRSKYKNTIMSTIDGRPMLYELSLKQLRALMAARGSTAVDIVQEYGGSEEISRKLHSDAQRGEPCPASLVGTAQLVLYLLLYLVLNIRSCNQKSYCQPRHLLKNCRASCESLNSYSEIIILVQHRLFLR
jgi:hypothetical protein